MAQAKEKSKTKGAQEEQKKMETCTQLYMIKNLWLL